MKLKRIAAERGWTVEHVFTDHPTSVRKGQDRRPGELALVQAIKSGGREGPDVVALSDWEISC